MLGSSTLRAVSSVCESECIADAAVLTTATGMARTTPPCSTWPGFSASSSSVGMPSSAATTQTTLTVSCSDRSTMALLCMSPSTPPRGCGMAANSVPVALSNSCARLVVTARDAVIVSMDTVFSSLCSDRRVWCSAWSGVLMLFSAAKPLLGEPPPPPPPACCVSDSGSNSTSQSSEPMTTALRTTGRPLRMRGTWLERICCM
mmetsp:Transcript_24488/g.76777  ORF Transcript_24488/g.76777 Transcript_24488/m.76777 type:complete len:203 (-) Transcript_24488:306-914(-)